MTDPKWLHTMEIYDEYERGIAKARAEKPLIFPLGEKRRSEIVDKTKKILGYRDELVPTVHNVENVRSDDFGTYTATQLRYETWNGFFGASTLFMPKGEEKIPMVFILCGHGDDGRRTKSYITAAHRLASMGIAVCIPDNIGQGDRQDEEKANHNYCHTPFYCGLTLQGMIVMETHAIIRYMINNPRIDKERVGSCGNSGGGTLNVFASALMPEIKVISSSGYPSEFTYILTKERRHCCCNLLPGIARGPEMWEMLSIFAPKPLLLEQGLYDDLIPIDLAQRNARKVENTYIQMNARENFGFTFTMERHSWAEADILVITNFLAEHLGITPKNNEMPPEEAVEIRSEWRLDILDRSMTTSEIAEKISGITMPKGTELQDIFKPKFEGREITPDEVVSNLGRGSVMRVLAQLECTLNGETKPHGA